jgi:2-polyprenyl-6-methoxyphenol hydroxylase-like FAD-dependent oxidoreductase
MPALVGRQALVVGAGMGGLTAARALADHFEHVLVLERDALPGRAEDRPGVPQGKHVHALLAGGQHALCDLFPGFDGDLARMGAVPIRAGLDVRVERPGWDPFPQRDLGFDAYAQSRAQLELGVRQQVQAHPGIEVRQQCRVQALIPGAVGARVTGAQVLTADGKSETVAADLVVDASGRGTPTLDLLVSIGQPRPAETTIGVDVAYSTAVFAIPDDAPSDWKGVFCFPQPPSSRGSLLLPMEGQRWIVTLAGRHGDRPPGDLAGFIAYAESLRCPTIHRAIRHARPLGEVVRYGFPESVHRHYDRIETFPRGLLPVGDAVCRFNPVYGQGMSVAAQGACALRRFLAARAGERDPLEGLAQAFFAEARALIETPWAQAAIPDFIHPDTRGERPANFEQTLRFGFALTKLMARDPAVHRLVAEVQNLLKPRSVYFEPELMERVMAVMAEGQGGTP